MYTQKMSKRLLAFCHYLASMQWCRYSAQKPVFSYCTNYGTKDPPLHDVLLMTLYLQSWVMCTMNPWNGISRKYMSKSIQSSFNTGDATDRLASTYSCQNAVSVNFTLLCNGVDDCGRAGGIEGADEDNFICDSEYDGQ